jgi:hypothetical protein
MRTRGRDFNWRIDMNILDLIKSVFNTSRKKDPTDGFIVLMEESWLKNEQRPHLDDIADLMGCIDALMQSVLKETNLRRTEIAIILSTLPYEMYLYDYLFEDKPNPYVNYSYRGVLVYHRPSQKNHITIAKIQ